MNSAFIHVPRTFYWNWCNFKIYFDNWKTISSSIYFSKHVWTTFDSFLTHILINLSLSIIKNYWIVCWRLVSIILAAQEEEIRSTAVQSQPRQIVHETLSRKILHKKGWRSGSGGRP
jgi:hypothetical protein